MAAYQLATRLIVAQSVTSDGYRRGFNSRSEFIRQAIRDSVHQTQLSPAALQALLESSQQARRGEFVSSDEIREEFLNE